MFLESFFYDCMDVFIGIALASRGGESDSVLGNDILGGNGHAKSYGGVSLRRICMYQWTVV